MAKNDERIVNRPEAPQASDDRLMSSRIHDESRDARTAHDRPVDDNRETLSDEERINLIINGTLNSALPDPPTIPGWHLCWLSTNNQYDPIERRIRMGYVPVQVHELRGWEFTTPKSSEQFPGAVSINEMVLFKIEDHIYAKVMKALHHDAPERQEEAIRNSMQQIEDQTRHSVGRKPVSQIGDGTERIVQRAPAPRSW